MALCEDYFKAYYLEDIFAIGIKKLKILNEMLILGRSLNTQEDRHETNLYC